MGVLDSKRSVLVLALTGVGGLLLLIAADRLSHPELIGPGLILFAVGIVATGGDAIFRRYTVERIAETARSRTYQGLAAVLIGAVLVLFGMAVGVTGVAFLIGEQHALYDSLLARPGIALVPVGLASAASGGARLLGAREWRGSVSRVLAAVPERLGGLILLLIGAALAAIGAFELIAPDAFDRELNALLAQLGLATP
jgi:hypothetical protein